MQMDREQLHECMNRGAERPRFHPRRQDKRTFFRMAMMAALSCTLLCALQISGPPKPRTVLLPEANRPPDANDQMRMQLQEVKRQNFDAANAERMRQIADESKKLILLTKDLHAKMEKIGKEPLPAELEREAEVIELLAHDVQEKMKLTVGAG